MGRLTQTQFPNDAASGGSSVISYFYGSPSEWPNDDIGSESLNESSSVVKRVFPGGATETELLDASGRRLALVDRSGATTSMRYGPLGTVREVRDATGLTLQTTYDALGRVTGTVDSIRGNSTTTYSSGLSDVVTVTTGVGTVVRENDVLGRVKKETRPEGTTTWTYDNGAGATGKIVSVVGPASTLSPAGTTITYSYASATAAKGSRGQVTSIKNTIAGTTYSIGYGCDAYGRTSSMQYPSAVGKAFGTTLSYDIDGNLVVVKDSNNASRPLYYELLSLTALNEVELEQSNGNVATSYAYYPLNGSLKSVTHKLNATEVSRNLLTYTESGSIQSMGLWESGVASTAARAFEYDQADRLTNTYRATLSGSNWTRGELLETVAHDGIGNITSKTGLGTYSYGLSGNPYGVTAIGGNTFQYDAMGRQTSRTGADIPGTSQSITYASYGQPTKVSTGTLGDTQYAYNGALERVMRKDSSGTTVYVGDLYRRTTDAAKPTYRTHVYSIKARGQTIAEETVQERNGAIYGSSEIRAIRGDHLGSPVLSIRSSDGDTKRTHYDSYGKTADALVTPTGTGFAGYGNEQALGLLKMGVRLYDPKFGVVLTPDSVAGTKSGQDSLNPYLYAFSRPTMMKDPTGLESDFFYELAVQKMADYFANTFDSTYVPLSPLNSASWIYGDYPGSWLLQTAEGAAWLDYAQNTCLEASAGAAVIGAGFAVAGLAGVSTVMGAEVGVPALSSFFDVGVTEAVVAAETTGPAVGQAMQSVGSELPVVGNELRAGGSLASDAINGARLANQLVYEEAASAFTETGGLSAGAIQGATQIFRPGALGNPAIPEGFAKYTTDTFASPSGPFQVHFYMNPTTSDVFYGLDYKVIFNGGVQPFTPQIGVVPPIFNSGVQVFTPQIGVVP